MADSCWDVSSGFLQAAQLWQTRSDSARRGPDAVCYAPDLRRERHVSLQIQ